jgi:predicted nuclease of predicted toxin-antitoxin system
MRLLLDECIPARLRKAIASHQVSTVPEEGWSGVKKRGHENLTAVAMKASAAMEM